MLYRAEMRFKHHSSERSSLSRYASRGRTAFLRRMLNPIPAKPRSNITHVEGSGTALSATPLFVATVQPTLFEKESDTRAQRVKDEPIKADVKVSKGTIGALAEESR